ncbi:MAG: sugar phosphate isomerase/epimerase [Alteromonadaceae bacterium]|nr:sugar phosphate isomerase/epimerase [Alteromonadaceae bacterium]
MSTQHFAISLDMINRHYSEPNRNRYESKYYWEELYTLIAAAGFDSIEIPFEPVWQFGGRSGVPMTQYSLNTKYGNTEQYRKLLADSGINRVSAVSFNANLFVRNDQLGFYFGASGHFGSQAIAFASELGADTLVLSPTAYAGRLRHYHPHLQVDDKQFIEQTKALIEQLSETAAKTGITLALRPEYWSMISIPVLLELVHQCPANVKLAVNTAHLQLAELDSVAFIQANAKAISYVQLADTPLTTSQSFSQSASPEFPSQQATQVFADVGTGSVPLTDVIKTLTDQDYSGDICLCNHQTRDPMRALLRDKRFVNQLVSQAKGV